jgi:hypothetical protein
MWQAPNQRIGAMANAKKRQQDRAKKPIHLRRVRAEIRLIPHHETFAQAESTGTLGELREARVILNDLSPKGIGIYSAEPMVPGNKVRITLEEPRRIVIEGKIVWCQDHKVGSAVLSKNAPNYRVGVKFEFGTPEEEKAFKEFCLDLQKNYLYTPDE